MQHYQSISDINLEDSWVAIGIFDGVHSGHQSIINYLVAGALKAGSPSVVLTFFPHPKKVLHGASGQFYLTSPTEKAELIGNLGVDYVITQLFDEKFSKTSASAFMNKLHASLKIKKLNVGIDFALGRDREGSINVLKNIGKKLGYSVNVIQPKSLNGSVISSSAIREKLLDGNVEYARELLGHPYQVDGEVIPGDGRGRLIGIPTANLDVWGEKLLPKAGVYACDVLLEGSVFGAVTNIGIRPTFESESVMTRVETHILNLDDDVYGKKLRLKFLKLLRDEIRFENIDQLVEQIFRDIESAKGIIKVEREGEF